MVLRMKLRIIFILSLSLAIFYGCDDSSEPEIQTFNVLETAQNNPNLSIFSSAIARANLSDLVINSLGITFFAPNDQAFENYFSARGISGLSDIPNDSLLLLLLYHSQNAPLSTSSINSGYLLSPANGGPNGEFVAIFYSVTNNNVIINESASVIQENVQASNGFIHILDEVLALPTYNSILSANPLFSRFTEALLLTGLNDTISQISPVTLFPPVDSAFDSFLEDFPAFDEISDVPVDMLSEIVKEHIVPGNLFVTDFESVRDSLTNLNGNKLLVLPQSDRTFVNNTFVELLNVQATDGILHFMRDLLTE